MKQWEGDVHCRWSAFAELPSIFYDADEHVLISADLHVVYGSRANDTMIRPLRQSKIEYDRVLV